MNKITLLGTGTSTGVPILGCNCQVCQSNDPRNKRLRTSAIIHTSRNKTILIDASPDLRTQLLKENTQFIDAVIITHDHADHTHGMDDLRPFSFKRKEDIPIFTDTHTIKSLENKFPYIFKREIVFKNHPVLGGGIPLLKLNEIQEQTQILDESVTFFSLPHGHTRTLGILHSKLAYIVDCHEIEDKILSKLNEAKLDILIIDCLREEAHQTHLTLDKSLSYIEKINPKLAILTHLGHELEFHELQKKLVQRKLKNVLIGLDGMSFLYS